MPFKKLSMKRMSLTLTKVLAAMGFGKRVLAKITVSPAERRQRHWRSWCGGLVVALSSSLLGTAEANVLIDSQGFESPTYTAGDIHNQDDWYNLGSAQATVQSSTVHSGSQALEVHRDSGAEGYWAHFPASTPTSPYVTIEWQMMVEWTNAEAGYGPLFGMTLFDEDLTSLLQVATLGVDASTGDVLVQEAGTGYLAETGFYIDFDVWSSFQLMLDFSEGSYLAYVDGTLVATDSFIDGSGITGFTDVDIMAVAANFDTDSYEMVGTAYFDDVLVKEVVAGDYNDDGTVDLADYVVWRNNVGNPTGTLANDFEGTEIGISQYEVWKAAYGGSVPASLGATQVPEPATWLLATAMSLALAYGARRRVG